MVDNGDAVLPGAGPDDDLIYGYGGSDSINAGGRRRHGLWRQRPPIRIYGAKPDDDTL